MFIYSLTVCKSMINFGSLCNVSAYRSEDMYQKLMECYAPGTMSLSKQAIQNMLVKYASRRHVCKHNPKFTTRETCRTQDNYVFVDDYVIYKIVNISEETDSFECVKIRALPFVHILQNSLELKFHELGVFRGPCTITNDHRTLRKVDIRGKAVVANSYIVCLPFSLLCEQSY